MPKTLLLADDSVVIQKLVGLSFANEDVELVTVDNGDDAIARARELGPDLVLADVVMPGKSGYEVCEAIKSDPQRAQTPVLLLTGTFEAFDEARAQAAGADGHITKPFEAQALVERVNELLARSAKPAAAASVAAPPAGEVSDFFDDNLGDIGGEDLTNSLESPISPPAPETDFAFGGSEPLGPFGSRDEGLGGLDLPPSLDEPSGNLSNPGPALGGAGGDETVAIMPGLDEDPLANTADMPAPPIPLPEIPLPGASDPGATVLADDSFGAPPIPASMPEPPATTPSFDSFRGSSTEPQSPAGDDFLASIPAPEVPLPPASPEPPPLPGSSGQSDSGMDLDDLSFRTQPPIPSDPAETMLADDLFAGAPPLSDQPVADLDPMSSPGSSGLDLDFDTASPGDTGGSPSPFVPDNAGDYDVSSSDLGPPPPLGDQPDWATAPSSDELPRTPFGTAHAAASASTAPIRPVETAASSARPLGSLVEDMAGDPMSRTGGAGAAASSPFEAPLGSPDPVHNDDWPMPEEPLTQVDTLDTGAPEPSRPPPAVSMPQSSVTEAPAPEPGTGSALIAGKPDLSPMMRDRVHDTLEKVAWEAFSDMSETIVRQVLQRVEEIAWEVIPQMTESLVREEIRRMKDEDES